ncbi:uncharacterized protein [Procambarus clarkii]|uniref:uncharacterized protein isoform X1 n=1 Tax=Procambarus clarkii TaxID=6728 RepID=UPI00374454B6
MEAAFGRGGTVDRCAAGTEENCYRGFTTCFYQQVSGRNGPREDSVSHTPASVSQCFSVHNTATLRQYESGEDTTSFTPASVSQCSSLHSPAAGQQYETGEDTTSLTPDIASLCTSSKIQDHADRPLSYSILSSNGNGERTTRAQTFQYSQPEGRNNNDTTRPTDCTLLREGKSPARETCMLGKAGPFRKTHTSRAFGIPNRLSPGSCTRTQANPECGTLPHKSRQGSDASGSGDRHGTCAGNIQSWKLGNIPTEAIRPGTPTLLQVSEIRPPSITLHRTGEMRSVQPETSNQRLYCQAQGKPDHNSQMSKLWRQTSCLEHNLLCTENKSADSSGQDQHTDQQYIHEHQRLEHSCTATTATHSHRTKFPESVNSESDITRKCCRSTANAKGQKTLTFGINTPAIQFYRGPAENHREDHGRDHYQLPTDDAERLTATDSRHHLCDNRQDRAADHSYTRNRQSPTGWSTRGQTTQLGHTDYQQQSDSQDTGTSTFTNATARSGDHPRSTESSNTGDRQQQPMQSDMQQRQHRRFEQQRCTGSTNTRNGHEQSMQSDLQQYQQQSDGPQLCTDSNNVGDDHELSMQCDLRRYDLRGGRL